MIHGTTWVELEVTFKEKEQVYDSTCITGKNIQTYKEKKYNGDYWGCINKDIKNYVFNCFIGTMFRISVWEDENDFTWW